MDGQIVGGGDDLYGVKLVDGSKAGGVGGCPRTMSCRDQFLVGNHHGECDRKSGGGEEGEGGGGGGGEGRKLEGGRKVGQMPGGGRCLSEMPPMEDRLESLADMFLAKGVDIGEYYDVKMDPRTSKKRGGRKAKVAGGGFAGAEGGTALPSRLKMAATKFSGLFASRKKASKIDAVAKKISAGGTTRPRMGTTQR